MNALLVVLSVVSYAFGQVFVKLAFLKLGPLSLDRVFALSFLVKALTTWEIILAVLLWVLATALYLWVLAKLPLTVVFPFLSLLFPVVMVLGWLILGEPLTWRAAAGTGLLVIGLYLIGSARLV